MRIILLNITSGNNVVIGAGSIVTKSIPANCIAASVAAKVLMQIKEYYEKNLARIDFTDNLNS